MFYPKNCFVSNLDDDKVIFSSERVNNVYVIDLNKVENKEFKCHIDISHDAWTWHRRLGYANFELLNDFSKSELVNGLPKIKFIMLVICTRLIMYDYVLTLSCYY